MQTLNVGAGRTDDEYKEAQERHREELREDSQSDANYFFWAAALAGTSSGLFAVQINFLINTGVFDLLRLYGRRFGTNYPTVFEGTVVMWLAVLCALGFAARKGHRSSGDLFNMGIWRARFFCPPLVPRTKGT